MKKALAILTLLSTAGCIYYVPSDEYVRKPLVYDDGEAVVEENEEITFFEEDVVQKNIVAKDFVVEKEFLITPQEYGVLATRITNKMLDDTANIYQTNEKPKIYIKEIINDGPNLPDGFYYANQNLKDIVKNSKLYEVVNNIDDADYSLSSTVSEYSNPNTFALVVLYSMQLKDKSGIIVNEWVESLSQPTNEEGFK